MNISKAKMKEIAKESRRRGFFQSATTDELYVYCPECGEKVECQDFRYAGPNGARLTSPVQMIDAGMIAHLTDYCGEE